MTVLNWSYLHHAIGAMQNEEEFQEVAVLGSDSTVIEIADLKKTEDGRWVLVETADTITDAQLRELFAEHCECRPIDTARISHTHDCDTLYTDACREALHGFVLDGEFVTTEGADRRAARARCAELLK
jgi:hypothetical protein